MESILVYLSIIHNGEWNEIYQDILDKQPVDKNEVEKEIEKLTVEGGMVEFTIKPFEIVTLKICVK